MNRQRRKDVRIMEDATHKLQNQKKNKIEKMEH